MIYFVGLRLLALTVRKNCCTTNNNVCSLIKKRCVKRVRELYISISIRLVNPINIS